MDDIPRDAAFDNTLALMREGYHFISRRCDALDTDFFETRVMLQNVICMRGPEAGHLFYEHPDTTRVGAMPSTTLWLLQDAGSVQQLDGEKHRDRKAMFIRMLANPAAAKAFVATFRDAWLSRLQEWEHRPTVRLLDEANLVLTIAACEWCGVPVENTDLRQLSHSLFVMSDRAGSFGPKMWTALWQRHQIEVTLRTLIEAIRRGDISTAAESPICIIAKHRDPDGELLDAQTATVELLNILRPIVAIGRYIAFTALALHEHPQWRDSFKTGGETFIEPFVEEVRRLYPFFPFVGAKAKRDIEWYGYTLPKGQWLLFDLFGTSRDQNHFDNAEHFDPERRVSWKSQDFNFVPQGGGDTETSHRCPGEMIVVETMKETVRLLCREMHYTVPDQDMKLHLNRIPAAPADGFVLADIRRHNH
ncbi:cytochrome P450 [Thalassospira australica]|uniref:cytochrome P450 n=1 Tax=Thalassospira australica TaxID=1528106 RepID=UPI0038514203